jgi:DNA primase
MAATWVDFKQIKADVGIEQVLARYGVRLRSMSRTEWRGRCPLPMHHSSRSRDSFMVNLARNVWSCHSQSCTQARGGRAGGNVLDLVALMEGCSIRDAALRLRSWSGVLPPRTVMPLAETRPEPNTPLPFSLQHVDGRHPYLAARGLTRATIRAFGVGLYRGRGFLRGRIVIPIHNEQGELMAYVGRAPDDAIPKYRFPKGFRKSLVLFNLHRACATEARDIVVVEGFFDTFAVHQAGYPAVVALMGSTLSPYQADLLSAHFDRVLLMLDSDDAGRHGTATITPALAARMPVSAIELENGRQPDQLTRGEIRRLLRASECLQKTGDARGDDDPERIEFGSQQYAETADGDRDRQRARQGVMTNGQDSREKERRTRDHDRPRHAANSTVSDVTCREPDERNRDDRRRAHRQPPGDGARDAGDGVADADDIDPNRPGRRARNDDGGVELLVREHLTLTEPPAPATGRQPPRSMRAREWATGPTRWRA